MGTPMNPSNLQWDFLQVLFAAGIKRISTQNLRPSVATRMLNNGMHLIAVSKFLGLVKSRTMMDIYGRQINEKQDEAAWIIEKNRSTSMSGSSDDPERGTRCDP